MIALPMGCLRGTGGRDIGEDVPTIAYFYGIA
jgi:hypothetical protein